MTAWLITVKEIKQHFRDYRTLFFLLAFPILLILVLGITLTNAFSSEVKVDGIHVLVNDASTGQLKQSYAAFEKQLGQMGMTFDALKPGEDGRKEVEDDRYTAFVEVKDSGLSMFGSSVSTIESNIVQGMMSAFTDKYNAAAAVAQGGDPADVQLLLDDGGSDYIKEQSVVPDRKPGAMDYYAVSMTVMIGLWGAMSAGGLLRSETVRGTGVRLLSAPIRRMDIHIGKIAGNVIANSLCILVVVFFSKWAFKAYWGSHLPVVIAVLICEAIMATSLGIAANEIVKGGGGRGLVMLVIQLASFMGGAYFPVDSGGIMGFIAWLSPLRWGINAVTGIIYGGNVSAAWSAIGLYLGMAVLLLLATVSVRRNKEGL